MTDSTLKILRIEVDGHFHGSAEVPKPWVAQIDGVDAKYGLARTFVQQLRDYRAARRAWSGNLHGVVVAFPLHEGRLYEVSRLRGRSSKRYVAREFVIVQDGTLMEAEPLTAVALAEGYAGPAIAYEVPDGTCVTRVDGLGTPAVCGFVLVDGHRIHRLRVGAIHEISTASDRHLVLVGEQFVERISHADALAFLISIIGPLP